MSTSRQSTELRSASIANPYHRLVDDAALFPPGNALLPEAVLDHLAHRRAAYTDLIGAFVVSDATLPELIEQLADEPSDNLEVAVVVSGGAGALAPAVRWARRADQLTLGAVEIALRDEDDLAHNARRVTTMVDQLVADGHLDEATPVYVEPPRLFGRQPGHSWRAALDEVAGADLRLKFRTGGLHTDDFPAATELATCIESALDRELPFKCTAGLHRAVRHRDAVTEFEHHGFLNVLLATKTSLDGGGPDAVTSVLAESDATTLVQLLRTIGEEGLVSARRWFTGFGSCNVHEPLTDLSDLGLLPGLGRALR